MFKGFVFALDGTVYLGDTLVPGADRVIRFIRERRRKVVFVSDSSPGTREDDASKLTRLGIPTNPDEVIHSSFVMVHFLKKTAPRARLFAIGEPPFIEELRRAGFVITDHPSEIDYVVSDFDRTFDDQKLNTAFQAINLGAHFVATHPRRTFPGGEGEIPGYAGIIAAVEAVTLKKVEVVIGKPSPVMMEAVLDVLILKPDDCVLIGDGLETDIRMAKEAGMAAGIVLTGVTDEETLRASKGSPLQPDFIFRSIAGVENLLIG